MKDVRLAFGRRGLDVAVPDDAVVVRSEEAPALEDERAAIASALRAPMSGPPLTELVKGGGKVVVVFPDITRPMPTLTVLPALLEELRSAGAGPGRVTLVCATGTHRRATEEEMREVVGPDVHSLYEIHQHDCGDTSHLDVGTVDSTPVLLDGVYVDAEVRIVTGLVEPHFFAGFSGGPKGVFPGLGGLSTILEAHSRNRISDPRATWLVTEGNPVHDFVRAAVALAPPDLSVDVTVDSGRRLTGVFAAPLPFGHRAACAFVERTAVRRVDGRFDVVVTTNGGHPLDRNLYQAVKGLSAAERVVKDDGVIVLAAACGDGIPSRGGFADLLRATTDGGAVALANGGPAALANGGPAGPGQSPPAVLDGWQAQVLGRVLQRARVMVHSEGLADPDVRMAQMEPVNDVTSAIREAASAAGPRARVCVLPEGPLTVVEPVG